MSESIKVPPNNIDAERAVIGALFLDPDSLDQIDLKADDFYSKAHQSIYTAIVDLAAEGKPFDLVTTGELLEKRRLIDSVGGLAYMMEIQETTPGSSNVASHARFVKQKATLRGVLKTSMDVGQMVFDPALQVEDILDRAAESMLRLSDKTVTDNAHRISEVVGKYLDGLDARYQNRGKLIGLPTGWTDLDNRLSGLAKGNLIVVAGRPSMGKTAFVCNIAEKLSVEKDFTTLFFSLEQTRDELLDRISSSTGNINLHSLRTGNMNESDWGNVVSLTERYTQSNLVIDESSAINPLYLRTQARRVQRRHGLDLIIVDYMQLMTSPGQENRTQEISHISRALKNIAKDFNVPVIALSQLNRGLEARSNKRPMMSDLRESGSIEQDADVILFIYRDEVYDADTPDKGVAEIIIAKHRNGSIGTVKLVYQGQYTRFENYAFNSEKDWLEMQSA